LCCTAILLSHRMICKTTHVYNLLLQQHLLQILILLSSQSLPSLMFALSSVVEHRKQARKSTFACFVDICKAYDNVKCDLLWKKLQKMGMPNQILELLKCIYTVNTSCVKVNEFLTRPFEVTMGLCQGCVLSPLLFNLYINDLPSYIHFRYTWRGQA